MRRTMIRGSRSKAHRVRTSAALAAIGVLFVSVAGCTGSASAAPSSARAALSSVTSVQPSAARASTADRRAPLTCLDLVSRAKIAAALHGPHFTGRTVTPTTTAAGLITGEKAIQGAGGLSCSWTVDTSSTSTRKAVFTASVLPGAAKEWSALLFGDGPSSSRRTFAGVSAAAACGDPGCAASAVVGAAWVRVDLTVQGLGEGRSVFANESERTIFANAGPAIAAVFSGVQHATPAQLRFPNHLAATRSVPRCTAFLGTAALARAMKVRSASYIRTPQPTGASDSIAGAAQHRIGTAVCFASGAGSNPDGIASITIAPRQAWAVGALVKNPDYRGAFTATTLPGQTGAERALTDCHGAGTPCTTVFALGSTAIQVDDTRRSTAIAEAILAQAR